MVVLHREMMKKNWRREVPSSHRSYYVEPIILTRQFFIHKNIIKKQQRERKITSVVDTASMDGFMERFTLRNIVFACF